MQHDASNGSRSGLSADAVSTAVPDPQRRFAAVQQDARMEGGPSRMKPKQWDFAGLGLGP
jgi:hypothetical protein